MVTDTQTQTKVYTAAEIMVKVSTDPKWIARAIVAIYQRQTSTEQMIGQTTDKNGIGFNGVDAFILSSFAQQIISGRTLSEKQLAIAFRKMPKYSGQLAKIANGEA